MLKFSKANTLDDTTEGIRPFLNSGSGSKIVITTHQVEEVEPLLTDLIFIQKGKIVLDKSMDQVGDDFFELEVHGDHIVSARELGPIYERSILGGVVMMFEHGDREKAAAFGRLRNPSVVDLFVAKMSS